MIALILQCLLLLNVHAGLVSSMPSTYMATGIPNSHLVTQNVIRGMAPRNSTDIDSLIRIGVTDFLIFKIDTNGDVAREINMLEEKGVGKTRITHLDFPWKDITDFRPVCEMTIDALIKLETADKNNRKIFIHCTVGEDRTGYLAGDPKKGMNIVALVRQGLTPAFLAMVDILNTAKKNKINLSKQLCQQTELNPISPAAVKKFQCKRSNLIR